MKRVLLALSALTIGYLTGHADDAARLLAQSPFSTSNPAGQAPANPRAATNLFLVASPPETRMQPGKAVHWTREQQANAKSHIQWAPEYRLTATTRPAAEPGKEPVSGELHNDNTQIYLVTGGSGTVIVEGTVDAKDDYLVAPGEHRGGPIKGGRALKVKVGDLISIPPDTWHIAYGDPGVPLQYLIIHVHTRTTAP